VGISAVASVPTGVNMHSDTSVCTGVGTTAVVGVPAVVGFPAVAGVHGC
jgi:hypothetical protein